ncbi:hypothetical protein [Streptomyces sp. NPDC127033]|uniref:hypothetical protein n=1 Tax=Streptomyces sp. NPDC127033 TaxID=3347110 RepID=UPI00365BD6CF
MATRATGYRTVESMRPAPDEEIVCVTMNSWSLPQRIIHAPGDGCAWQAEFGQDTGQESRCGSDRAGRPACPGPSSFVAEMAVRGMPMLRVPRCG